MLVYSWHHALRLEGHNLRQQHQNKNVWLTDYARHTALKARRQYLIVISTIISLAFLSASAILLHVITNIGRNIS